MTRLARWAETSLPVPLDLTRLWHDPGMGVLVVVLVVILPMAVMVGGGVLLGHRMMRRAPFPLPVAPDLACPFCGHGMPHGRIAYAGYHVWWEPGDAPRPRWWLARPGSHPVRGARMVFEAARYKVRVRGASVCETCEAVVIDPRAITT